MESLFCLIFLAEILASFGAAGEDKCDRLLPGQYLCFPPSIDPSTQQPVGCNKENLAPGKLMATFSQNAGL